MNYMFAIPYYQSKIDPTQYNKSEILSDIISNYNIDPQRNEWDNASDMHHSYNDKENTKFKAINYDQLLPLYTQHITNFLNNYSNTPIKFRFDVENYTCMSKGQFMRNHDHPESDFNAVHYLKFNEEVHTPLTYVNPFMWRCYSDRCVSEKMKEISTGPNSSFEKHSWYWDSINLNTKEDQIVISPSLLRHEVSRQKSDELRIAIVLNIRIEK